MEYRVWKMEYGYFVFEPVKTFGTMEISLEQDIYQTTLKTLSECVFLVFSRKDFENWFWNDPAAVAAQLKEMGQYLYAQSSKERLRVLLSGKDRMSVHCGGGSADRGGRGHFCPVYLANFAGIS